MPAEEPARVADAARPRYSYTQKVLHAFLVDGRLVGIPARERKRRVILRYIAMTDFEDGRAYPEAEVNQLLALRHRDVAAVRRHLVEHGYLERHAGVYRRRPMSEWPIDEDDAGIAQPREDASPEE